MGILWVQNIFSGVFHGSKIFPYGYFIGPKFFLMGIKWIQSFFSWVFHGSKIFSCGCFGYVFSGQFSGTNAISLKKGLDSIFESGNVTLLDYQTKLMSTISDGVNMNLEIYSGALTMMKENRL